MVRHGAGVFFIIALAVNPAPRLAEEASPRTADQVAGQAEAAPALPAPAQAYLDRLLERALAQKVHDRRFWHLVLHHRPTMGGGTKSMADGARFFFSPDGRRDPRAELLATLRAFFTTTEDPNQHPACRFPLRYRWLGEQLDFDRRFLPPRTCPGVERYLRALNARSASLIFSSYFMSSSASMFGHTLLKINSGHNEGSELLDWAIHFAAYTPPDIDPFTFAIKGLLGGFPGRFSTLPYHLKVREYNDMQNRDLWEYRLTLTPAEVERMLLHVVELESTHFNYFYLDENCSYQLLSLIEIARPGLYLMDEFPGWVAPGETVRVVMNQPRLVEDIRYRPSGYSLVRREIMALSTTGRRLFFRLLDGDENISDPEFQSMTEDDRLHMIDLLLSTLKYRRQQDTANEESRELYRTLLSARTKMPARVVQRNPDRRLSESPHLGHELWRLRVAGGSSALGPFAELAWRPAFHSLLNDDTGFAPFTNFEFLDFTLRYYQIGARAELEHLTLLRIYNLPRYESLARNLSYTVDSGVFARRARPAERPLLERYWLFENVLAGRNLEETIVLDRELGLSGLGQENETPLRTGQAGYAEAQFGLTLQHEYDPFWSAFRLSLLTGVRGEGPAAGRPARGGPAATVMFLYGSGALKAVLRGSAYGFAASGDTNSVHAAAGLRYLIDPDLEVRLEAGRRDEFFDASASVTYHW